MQIFLPDDFDPVKLFNRLCQEYPHALVSLVTIAGVGTWMGATPELLVRVEDKRLFHTIALAGTKPYQAGTNLKSVAWTQKEIEEQALVERYVISCFKKIRLREYEEHGPKTVVAGNLIHLRSDFIVDMLATNFSQLGSVMLQLLHPTSAICGTPMEASEAYLREHEGYNREFYGGYLGPVNMLDQVNIFVNLRCLQLANNDQALLYAGAGVTIDSVPSDEWKETELKMKNAAQCNRKTFRWIVPDFGFCPYLALSLYAPTTHL
ncbi:MAG: chorismate-binding protein [Bacteroidia bacterium]|nr:chorismate-binding protein [Bacteroidia bacterium]